MNHRVSGLFAPAVVGLAWGAIGPSLQAQPLQNGDIVIGANYLDGWSNWNGRFHLLRAQNLSVLFESGASGIGFAFPSNVVIDTHGRIVFTSPGCGSNSNSGAISRYDPATGQLTQLLCIPYIVGRGGPPPGFPPDADGFSGLTGLHLSRTLRVVIDDDVNGGTPQVSFAEAYGFSVAVHRPIQNYHPEAFRYIPDQDRVEPGVSTALLPAGGNGASMAADSGGTYYSTDSKVGHAQPDLTVDVNARTTIGGVQVTVRGTLRVTPRNEIIFDGDILDNIAIPNGTADCSINGQPVHDDNVPFDGGSGFHPLSISSIGVLDGGLYAVSGSGAAGYPYLFHLARRAPFLNPYICSYYNCIEHYGPYNFFQDPPPLFYATTDQGRLLGGDDNGGRVFSVSTSGYQLLASGLGRPRGVAAYPPQTPPLTAGALVVRVDSPLNVLVRDAQGRRLGHAADGTPVNDFGDGGAILALGPQGHPRVYCIAAPATGNYTLQMVGTGEGPYTVRGYAAETSTGGALDAITGTAHLGSVESRTLGLSLPIGIRFAPSCFPNCDGSTTVPVLNVLDFSCFLNKFAAGDPYANCDNSTTSPVLNVLDFSCFLNRFAAGCS